MNLCYITYWRTLECCDDIGGLQDIDFDSEDRDGTYIIFIYGDSTNNYDSRESELIEALQAAGYNAEYDTNSGSNVIVLRVTSTIHESTSIEKQSTDSIKSRFTVKASRELSSEIEWEPIPESEDDNRTISSWSTKVGGTYYWISRKSNGQFNVEYEYNGRILPVSPECEDVATFDMATNEFEDWLNSNSESSVTAASDHFFHIYTSRLIWYRY